MKRKLPEESNRWAEMLVSDHWDSSSISWPVPTIRALYRELSEAQKNYPKSGCLSIHDYDIPVATSFSVHWRVE